MKSRLALILVVPSVILTVLWVTQPVTALTDGYLRKTLEANGFSEAIIQTGIYAKSSHDVYQRDRRQMIHGIPKVNKDYVYEPDVLTWHLAMSAHRNQLGSVNPPAMEGMVQPTPMEPGAAAPSSPDQVQLTPLESGQVSRDLGPGADEKMQSMLARAREQGMRPDSQLQGASIKQRLLDHLNSMNSPALNPPVLAPLPKGKHGDSYDKEY